MKTVATQVNVPAQVLETITFVCDAPGCMWRGQRENEANSHEDEHLYTDRKVYGDNEFYWFETQENFRRFHRSATSRRCSDWDWKGRGWYRYREAREARYWTCVSIHVIKQDLIDEIKERAQQIVELRDNLPYKEQTE